jgi:hypothetical protein
VAWGKGEVLSPLDVVNPRDLREPGLAELVDIRLAVLASRLGVFFGNHRLEAMVIHESYFGLFPAPLSAFSPLSELIVSDPTVAALLAGKTLSYEHVPDRFDPGASQFLGRWSYAGHGVDLALYAASILDRQGIAVPPAPEALAARDIEVELYHPRYTMFGHAGALPEGDFVFRWELGAELDRPIPVLPLGGAAYEHQLIWMGGVTYGGIDDGSVGLEYAQSRVLDAPPEDALLLPVNQPRFAVRYTQSFLRETLDLTVVATAFGLTEFRGWLTRAELDYELRDALHLGLGYVTYQPASDEFGPLYGFDDNDRVFASLRWDFAVD